MATSLGPYEHTLTYDQEGHREFKVKYKVQVSAGEGLGSAALASGLPLVGDYYTYGTEFDYWALCKEDRGVSILDAKPGEVGRYYSVEVRFSTKPDPPDKQRCQDSKVEDPLLEPMKISGGFTKFTEEATVDNEGVPIINSAWEQIRGPQVEFDDGRMTVKVEQNHPVLEMALLNRQKDTVNQFPLWGLPARCWKLGQPTWERKFFGKCNVYFTRVFEFEANVKEDPVTGELVSGWDRDVLDEGTKVLDGEWDTDRASPTYRQYIVGEDPITFDDYSYLEPENFIRATDFRGENCRVILDGYGRPFDVDHPTTVPGSIPPVEITSPGSIHVEKYPESDFLLLGIPPDLE